MNNQVKTIGIGFFWDELRVGERFATCARTITETDLVNFYCMTWFTEELFTNQHDRDSMAIKGRVVPGTLVYAYGEGLVVPSIQHTGLAFLESEMKIRGPTFVGDTIRVEVEVTELKATSKPDRGLIRTRNLIRNQQGETTIEYTALRMLARRPQ